MIIGEILILIIVIIVVFSLLIGFLGNPFVPTPMKVVHLLVDSVDVREGSTIYDLGSGDGRVLFEVIKRFKVRGIGYEYSPLLYILSEVKRLFYHKKGSVEFRFNNYFVHDLSDANLIFCYILPSFMDKLRNKFEKELKSGTIIVSYTFQIKGWTPKKIIQTDNKNRPIYLYVKE